MLFLLLLPHHVTFAADAVFQDGSKILPLGAVLATCIAIADIVIIVPCSFEDGSSDPVVNAALDIALHTKIDDFRGHQILSEEFFRLAVEIGVELSPLFFR